MTVYVVGAGGRLGGALAKRYASSNVVPIGRNVTRQWTGISGAEEVVAFFERRAVSTDVVFVAAGLLDPRSPSEDLNRINYVLPKNIVRGVARIGMKVVTFGTVMEENFFPKNPYVETKVKLAKFVASSSSEVIHVRLHTLYGQGAPSPFMFLGQLLRALQAGRRFRMSSGRQLREFHHLEDLSLAVETLVREHSSGVYTLSHGSPFTLGTLAKFVLEHHGQLDLLELGALPDPPGENYQILFNRAPELGSVHFRDTLPAVASWLEEFLVG